jgi:T-complex protein 1 subunit alpha
MAETEGEEHFETSWLGECEEVKEINVGDNDFIYISGVKALKAVSIMIRGPNDYMIDEVERSVHDALCVVRRVLESNKVLSLSNLLLLSYL